MAANSTAYVADILLRVLKLSTPVIPSSISTTQLPRTRYQHRILLSSKESIRLLRIIPNAGLSTVRIHLQEFTINDCPPYIALSYTWGSPIQAEVCEPTPSMIHADQNILIDGSNFLAQGNLAAFLNLMSRRNFTGWLWVDQICVNQDEMAERSSQVNLMGTIYQRAESVIVWLGWDDALLSSYQWMLNDFIGAWDSFAQSCASQNIPVPTLSPLSPEFPQKIGFNIDSNTYIKKIREALMFYFSRRWFRRAWVIQEVFMAKTVSVYCHEAVFPYSKCDQFAQLSLDQNWITVVARAHIVPTRYTVTPYIPRRLLEDRIMLIPYTKSDELWLDSALYFLHCLRSRSASDARDKIFSLLGMLNQLLPSGSAPPFFADYSQSAETIFNNFAQLCIKNGSWQTVLSLVEDTMFRRLPALPSWTPDFTAEFHSFQLQNLHTEGFLPHMHNAFPIKKGDSCRPNINGSIFHSNGAICDHVIQTVTVWTGRHFALNDATENVVRIVDLWVGLPGLYTATGEQRSCAIAKTFVSGASLEGSKHKKLLRSQGIRSDFRLWWTERLALYLAIGSSTEVDCAKLLRKVDEMDVLNQCQEDRDGFPSKAEVLNRMQAFQHLIKQNPGSRLFDLKASISNEEYSFFDQALLRSVSMRAIFRTSKGYIGLGPYSMKSGDEICFLEGGPTPYVLRRQSDGSSFKFFGEAYLHGFMQGEILTPEFLESVSQISIT